MIEKIEKNEESEFTQVYAEILNTLHSITRMGASDNSEKELIENILHRFTKKEIKPEEARKEIQNFLNSRQDYH